MQERIMTLHPQGKQGVNISKKKYDQVRHSILAVLDEQPGILFRELSSEVAARLEGNFEGSISWYVTTVKLDLEARGVIERLPASNPQRLRRSA